MMRYAIVDERGATRDYASTPEDVRAILAEWGVDLTEVFVLSYDGGSCIEAIQGDEF